MDGLLEIGEIGLLRNIPEELDMLTSQINVLKKENNRLKSYLRIGGAVLAVIIVYRLYKTVKNREIQDEDIDS